MITTVEATTSGVWLAGRVTANLDKPIAGALLHQRAVHDVNFVSKASWIVTLIVAAVEQASQSENNKIFDPNSKPSPSEVNPLSHIPKVSPIVHYFLNTNAYLGLV
jgi:hypothetical protein